MRIIYFIIFLLISTTGYSQFSTEPVEEKVSLYPNPAKNTLWVNTSNKEVQDSDLAVYNVIGNKIELDVEHISEGKFAIDVNNLPTGYYLLVVENNDLNFTKTIKFLKS